jgi:hypothetical protein
VFSELVTSAMLFWAQGHSLMILFQKTKVQRKVLPKVR